MLFNEPKLLKSIRAAAAIADAGGFSALQRAEIAEMAAAEGVNAFTACFSALQRAEIAEIVTVGVRVGVRVGFSALQRAEIAEIVGRDYERRHRSGGFSALQRAEIAEMPSRAGGTTTPPEFQCSSTSRNC